MKMGVWLSTSVLLLLTMICCNGPGRNSASIGPQGAAPHLRTGESAVSGMDGAVSAAESDGGAAPSASQAVLKFDKTVHDFGDVPEGETVRCRFKVTNIGSVTLKGMRVLAGCGCSSASVSKRQLKPGESADIYVEIRTTSYSGFIARRVIVDAENMAKKEILYLRAIVVAAEGE